MKLLMDFKQTDIMAEYYQPTLEDFTIGFEYEFLTGGVEWKKFVFDMDRPQAVLENVRDYPTTFRVKYLDEEDIIELGGVLMHEEKGNPNKMFHIGDHSIIWNQTGWCIITVRTKERHEDYTAFVGTIKNKSELRRILKQVGITQ